MACCLVGGKPLSEPMLDGILILTLGTNFSEILSEIHAVLFKKMHLKMSSAKCQPFCLGLNVLNVDVCVICLLIYAHFVCWMSASGAKYKIVKNVGLQK